MKIIELSQEEIKAVLNVVDSHIEVLNKIKFYCENNIVNSTFDQNELNLLISVKEKLNSVKE